jgi:hypothetical protein
VGSQYWSAPESLSLSLLNLDRLSLDPDDHRSLTDQRREGKSSAIPGRTDIEITQAKVGIAV